MSHDYYPIRKPQPLNFKPRRFIIFGDIHFGVGANDDYFFRSMVMYFRVIVIPWLEQNLQPGDLIILTGDIFDNDTVIRTEIADAVSSIFEKMAKLAPIVIITGNHDVVKKKSNDINSLRGLGNIDGVHVYYDNAIWKCDYDKNLFLYPWRKEVETLEEFEQAGNVENCNYMLSHAHYNGLAFDNEYVKKVDGQLKEVDVKDLGMFDLVINGHIHRKQTMLNVLNVGSVCQLKYSDDNNEVGFHVLDLKDDKVTFIENTYSPRFHRDDIVSFLDMTKKQANDLISNKLVRINYPAELAKTFTFDSIRRELHGFVDIEFVPEYSYNDIQTSQADGQAPEVVDLRKILSDVATGMELPKEYTTSLVDELNEQYATLTRQESLEI